MLFIDRNHSVTNAIAGGHCLALVSFSSKYFDNERLAVSAATDRRQAQSNDYR